MPTTAPMRAKPVPRKRLKARAAAACDADNDRRWDGRRQQGCHERCRQRHFREIYCPSRILRTPVFHVVKELTRGFSSAPPCGRYQRRVNAVAAIEVRLTPIETLGNAGRRQHRDFYPSAMALIISAGKLGAGLR